MQPFFSNAGLQIFCGDCLPFMKTLAANSIDAVVTDPPYFKFKGEAWDHQWDTPAGFLAWVGELCEQWRRILKPNGSLYVFASPQMAARVECEIAKHFIVLNNIRWIKDAGWHKKASKEALRSYLSPWEAIIFAEHYGADNVAKGESGYAAKCDDLRGFVFEPLRAYLAGEFDALGWKESDLNRICGTVSMAGRHYRAQSQWCLPTATHYSKLQAAAAEAGRTLRQYEDLRRQYEDLRRQYEDLRRQYEDLRRPFSVSPEVPYTDVWDFAPVGAYPGKHPCEKPVALLRHIIATSTRTGGVVLDCFMGSGSTGVACKELGRVFIGCDASEHWCGVAKDKIESAGAQLSFLSTARPMAN